MGGLLNNSLIISWDRCLVVMAGAALGGVARYVIADLIMRRFTGRFPLWTFLVNVSGCFLIGVVLTLLAKGAPHPHWRLFLVVGVLGGYTTFSSFAWESYALIREGAHWVSVAYVIASVIVGYLAVLLGVWLAARR